MSLFISLFILCTSIFGGCSNTYNDVNYSQNMINYSLTVLDDGIAYYVDSGNGHLYKYSLDSGKIDKISNNLFVCLNKYDDWIYYINTEFNTIEKIKIDGSQVTLLYDDTKVNYLLEHNENLYFIDDDKNLYSMNLDGRNVKFLCDSVNQISFWDDNLYCLNTIDELEKYKISIKNKETNKFCELFEINNRVDWFCVYKNKVYYSSLNSGIYEYEIDSGIETSVYAGFSSYYSINMINGYLYYVDPPDELDTSPYFIKRISVDTKEVIELKNKYFNYLTVSKDKLFYYGDGKFFMSDLDGSNEIVISQSLIGDG